MEDRAGTAKYLHLLMHACPCHSFGWLSFTQQVLNTCYPLWLLFFFAGESDSEAQALWRTFALEWTVLLHTKELLPWLLPKAFPSSSGWTSESWMRFCFYPLLCHSCCILPLPALLNSEPSFVCLYVFQKGTGCNCIVYYAEEGLWSLSSIYTPSSLSIAPSSLAIFLVFSGS